MRVTIIGESNMSNGERDHGNRWTMKTTGKGKDNVRWGYRQQGKKKRIEEIM